jgi:NAD(P)-dependent dehydrogenase (short-subunit alcohol dehydrogenase family)
MISGANRGIGLAIARELKAQGFALSLGIRRPGDFADPLANGDDVLVCAYEANDRAAPVAWTGETVRRFGRIDVLVNNAGFGLFGVFEAAPRQKIQEQFDVNVFGVMDVTRALLPHFRANRAGTIVNISSGAGVFALPMISLYCASKFALEGFSEALSYELGSLGIAVKIVEPGGVTRTGFGERSAAEAGSSADLPDYGPFLKGAMEVFAGLRASRADATSEEVAEVIYTAATDGTDQLRYIATEDIKPLVRARRETSEAEYMAFMRERVTPRG